MNNVIVVFQVLLLVAALPVLAMSLTTSRSRRARHSNFMAISILLVLLAVILALVSVAISADDRRFDYALAFIPPAFTFGVCAWVIWRALGAAQRPPGVPSGGPVRPS